MSTQVSELENEIFRLQLQIDAIQKDCVHEWKTAGAKILYNKKLIRDLEVVSLDDKIFSIRRCVDFRVKCVKCDKTEERSPHQICFFCLGELGEEIACKSWDEDGCLKECLNCHSKFYWVRDFNIDEGLRQGDGDN